MVHSFDSLSFRYRSTIVPFLQSAFIRFLRSHPSYSFFHTSLANVGADFRSSRSSFSHSNLLGFKSVFCEGHWITSKDTSSSNCCQHYLHCRCVFRVIICWYIQNSSSWRNSIFFIKYVDCVTKTATDLNWTIALLNCRNNALFFREPKILNFDSWVHKTFGGVYEPVLDFSVHSNHFLLQFVLACLFSTSEVLL